MSFFALPAGVILETAVTGMTDGISGQLMVHNALFTTSVLLAVLDLRETSRNYFGATKGMKKKFCDWLFYFSICVVYKVVAYVASGEDDISRIALGTLLTSFETMVTAPVMLASGDLFESAYGVLFKNLSAKAKNVKRFATAVVIAGLITATTVIYSHNWPAQSKSIDNIVLDVSYSEE